MAGEKGKLRIGKPQNEVTAKFGTFFANCGKMLQAAVSLGPGVRVDP
jgi:hypothetical protein